MLNQFLLGCILAAQILGLTLPQTLEEGVYAVPTVTDEGVKQEILPAIATAASSQTQPQSVVFYRFLPPTPNRPQPPIRIATSDGPGVRADAAMLMDRDTGAVLWQKNPSKQRSIASITKLATALVYLRHQPVDGSSHIHTIAPEDNAVIGYNLTFPTGTQVTTGNLFNAMLLGSLNNAALALQGATGLPRDQFIADMNHLAEELRMSHTSFVDQTGVSNNNMSTAGDIALLAQYAFAQPDIHAVANTGQLEVTDVTGKILRTVHTTNGLVGRTDVVLEGFKTGTTEGAGYCYVFQANIEGHSVIGVVLGSTSDADRFSDALTMIRWTGDQFDWK